MNKNYFMKGVIFIYFSFIAISCSVSQENGYNELKWGSNIEELQKYYPNAVLAYKGGEYKKTYDKIAIGFFIDRYELLIDENYDKYDIPSIIVYSEKELYGATEHESARYFFYKDNKLFKVWYQLDIKPNEYSSISDMLIEKYKKPTSQENKEDGWEHSIMYWNINNNQNVKFVTTHYGTYRSWGYILYYNPQIEKEIDDQNASGLKDKIQI